MKKKLSIFALGLLNLSTVIHATPHTSLDLTPMLQDRFEKNCAIRQQFDFYTHDDEIQAILMNQVVKDEVEEQAAYVSRNFSLKNTTYRGLVVNKIEFLWGRGLTLSETLYFDLPTASAKQQFNKIKSNIQQPAKAANFVMTGEGKSDAIAICSWPDKNGHQ